MRWKLLFLSASLILSFQQVSARTEVTEEGSSVEAEGEKEAGKYFRRPAAERAETKVARTSSDGDHYLALHLGSFLGTDSYQWGQTPHTTNTGRLTVGVSYRLSSASSLADWIIRADFMGYELPESRALQLGLIPMLVFPEAGSKFPLYFGLGAGPGIFFTQLPAESFLAFDYQLIAGARMFDVLENTGFFIEGGLKNHILLMSDGQFNGFFLAVGAIFSF